MSEPIRKADGYSYIEKGEGHTLILLHGLFGALSNWERVLNHFAQHYRVAIPLIPIYQGEPAMSRVEELADYLLDFIAVRGYEQVSLIGNSLGGHIGLIMALKQPEQVHSLTLTGSSGLFEEGMGGGFPRRGDYAYIRERVQYTFYDPATAHQDLIDEVFDIVNDRTKAIRVIRIARNAQQESLRQALPRLQIPTCLIWGLNDNITPPPVAHEFLNLLPKSELHFIDRCGHAPMMEHPDTFNRILSTFLEKNPSKTLMHQAC
jgi:pimeloyl-ACP methyl ester carboxylesterase